MSVYIHIPFCTNICSYCDFCKIYKFNVKEYLKSLKEEIKQNYKDEVIETLYIGGGTPSSLSIEELSELFNIIKIFKTKNLEFTIECNIEDISEEKLQLFKKNKINRISIGIQTFNKSNLKLLNRNYNIDIIEKVNMVKKHFTNINIDLMYGFKKNYIKKDLEIIKQINPTHISTYSLIIEPNTKLYNDNYKGISEDRDYEIYKYIYKELKKQGYIHYEISNFAKKGYESKHNLTYWNNKEYYGFGLGASGYINGIRYDNTRSITHYLNSNFKLNINKLNLKDKKREEFILGFRKIKGINKNNYFLKYKEDIHNDIVNKLLKEEKLLENDKYIYINPKYIYVSNEILINFI